MRFHIIERLVTIYVNYEICHCNYADNGIAAGAYESDAISVAQSNSDTLPVIWLCCSTAVTGTERGEPLNKVYLNFALEQRPVVAAHYRETRAR